MGLRPTPRDRDNLIAAHKDLGERLQTVERAIPIAMAANPAIAEVVIGHYVTGLCLRLNLQVDIERSES